jgi:hypothetical protein
MGWFRKWQLYSSDPPFFMHIWQKTQKGDFEMSEYLRGKLDGLKIAHSMVIRRSVDTTTVKWIVREMELIQKTLEEGE